VLISFEKFTVRRLFVVSAMLISMLAPESRCYGADIVFIRSNRGIPAEQEELREAASFYGLGLRVVAVSLGANNLSIRKAVEQKETAGVAIDANVLSTISGVDLRRALHRTENNDVPLLIMGIGPDLSPALLKTWSDARMTRCTRHESSSRLKYTFGSVEGVTRQLSNLDIPVSFLGPSYLALDGNDKAQQIMSVRDGSKTFPVFAESTSGRQAVFLTCATSIGSKVADSQDLVSSFLRIAPGLIFIRYCAGERGWHSLHYYANFTIDDPWLRQPYGYADYKGLLGEMEKHNFHTTIAFIPWNYARSEPEVVSLFQHHPDRFSIAVHGNDHDHKEFTDYRSKSLALQVADLKQALARMERFQTLTGIEYDKVMVFPHSIAPEQTLGALKTYNYLATINSSNVPQNAVRPTDPLEVLRPVTLSFAGFPSISRYSAEVTVTSGYIAISQFLGNSLFLYAHSNLFSKGIGAFDHVADEVNELEPATEWRSLGEIVRHLYVVKLRDDANYDVMAFSSNICIENRVGRNATYYVQKQETGEQTISSVTLNGKVLPYTLQERQIHLTVAVPAGGTSCIAIQYANEMRLGSISAEHDSVVVYLLRMGSDFRDIYLAKFGVGLAAIRIYNKYELKPVDVVGCLLLLLAAMIYIGWRLLASLRRRSPPSQDRPCSPVS